MVLTVGHLSISCIITTIPKILISCNVLNQITSATQFLPTRKNKSFLFQGNSFGNPISVVSCKRYYNLVCLKRINSLLSFQSDKNEHNSKEFPHTLYLFLQMCIKMNNYCCSIDKAATDFNNVHSLFQTSKFPKCIAPHIFSYSIIQRNHTVFKLPHDHSLIVDRSFRVKLWLVFIFYFIFFAIYIVLSPLSLSHRWNHIVGTLQMSISYLMLI